MLVQPLRELDINVQLHSEIKTRSRARSTLECRERFSATSAIWQPSDPDTLTELISRDRQQPLDPDSWVLLQPHLSPIMRAILLDWLTEISAGFMLKRETCHMAIQLIDLQMQLSPGILKSEYQLIAVAALSIASKFEEIRPPRMCDYELATDKAYNQAQIRAMERKMLASVGWRVLPATLSHWLGWAMKMWDEFVVASRVQVGRFREQGEESYWRYLQAMTLADAVLLDYRSLRLPKSHLSAAILYLTLAHSPSCAPVHFDLFELFLHQAMGLSGLADLTPALELLALYAALPVTYTVPKTEGGWSHYENILAGQTHLSSTLKYARRLLQPGCGN